jgi:hypothetical protein
VTAIVKTSATASTPPAIQGADRPGGLGTREPFEVLLPLGDELGLGHP